MNKSVLFLTSLIALVIMGCSVPSQRRLSTLGACPGSYVCYLNYKKTIAQGWGWKPSTNTTVHTASDTNRTDTWVEALGKYGDVHCGVQTVTVPHPPASPSYRFSIYFPSNCPSPLNTNVYKITLTGFDP